MRATGTGWIALVAALGLAGCPAEAPHDDDAADDDAGDDDAADDDAGDDDAGDDDAGDDDTGQPPPDEVCEPPVQLIDTSAEAPAVGDGSAARCTSRARR